MRQRKLGLLILSGTIAAFMACDDPSGTTGVQEDSFRILDHHPAKPAASPATSVVADFSITDVNPNSRSYQHAVSPRDYEGAISAWYFGHAT